MTIDAPLARRLILGGAILGLAARLAFGLLYWTGKPLTHDEREYLALAESLSAGRGFAYGEDHDTGTAQQFGRAPVYPLFLAAIGAGAGPDPESSPARVKTAQAIVGAAGVWLLGLIVLRGAGPRAGAAAALAAAVYPPLVWMPAYVLSETLYSTLALAVALLLDRAVDRASTDAKGAGSVRLAAAAGIVAGLAALVRPGMLFFLPLGALWLARQRRARLAVVLVVAALAAITPWTIRNLRVYDRFVLIASEGGVTFWTGNHPLAIGEGDMAANPAIKRAELAFRQARPGLSAEELEPEYYRDALGYIARHPLWWIGLLARKAWYTLLPLGPSYTLHSTAYFAASVVSYGLLLPVAVWGWWTRRRARPPQALFVLAASAVLAGLVFFPQERFRIPVIDPALIACAAACADRWIRS